MTIPIRSSAQLMREAQRCAGHNVVAVAMAQDPSVLQAVIEARQEGIVDAILVGDEAAIRTQVSDLHLDLQDCRILHATDPAEASRITVQLVVKGEAHFLMKGFVKTAVLLKALLAEPSLKVRDVLSHVAVLDIPGRDRLFLFTDGGMIPKPTPEQKAGICRNMIDLARVLGIVPFHFGFLVPYTDSNTPEHHQIGGQLSETDTDVDVLGDITPETAFAQADGVVVSEIEACNTITKGLTRFTETVFSGLVMGAKAPVCLVSRSDTAANKKASLALGVLYANGGVS